MRTCTLALAIVSALVVMAPSDLLALRIGAATPIAQERTLEEITGMIAGPGVYLDAGPGVPRLSAVTGSLPSGLDFQTRPTPQPVWMKIDGPRATVRTGPQPTFYFYQVEAPRAGRSGASQFAVTLHAALAQGDTRRLTWPGTFSVEARDRIARPDLKEAIECTVEELAEGLFRVRPAAPLQSGEFAFLPGRALAEVSVSLAMGTRYSPRTRVYAFGVDLQ